MLICLNGKLFLLFCVYLLRILILVILLSKLVSDFSIDGECFLFLIVLKLKYLLKLFVRMLFFVILWLKSLKRLFLYGLMKWLRKRKLFLLFDIFFMCRCFSYLLKRFLFLKLLLVMLMKICLFLLSW